MHCSYDDPSAEFTPRDRKRKTKNSKVGDEHSTDSEKPVETEDGQEAMEASPEMVP